ncbi:MAG: HAMP domain-containing sensor histidine kinase [Reichenbachiella sp.]|uniref:sensor histidine kinase n=1 Tax=Reichenbachiella sp. TaxID=2184521 RepID=UPI00296704C0|nr:HAMP domain-containing sensor histidine kinase [Reichenbachiella sp.]MDW3210658.1 HAMP domain-containing sensor histidine kinase [Reichenbachiella sp.]
MFGKRIAALQATSLLSDSGSISNWLILLFAVVVIIGAYLLFRLYTRRTKIQRKVLQRKVEKRTSEISKQKEELEEQSEKLKKAYEEIKVKNIAIEEAFEHLTNSFSKLSDLNREKDGIISIVAHDLRTPLNNIEGLIQLVSMDGNLNDDQKDYIDKIRSVVRHGNEMIRDLLDINQAKNQKPELKISTLQLGEFVNSWQANFEKSLSSKKQKLELAGDYQSLELQTDQGLLSRIMDNLMSNAIKFSEKGTTIFIDINEEDEQLVIKITDEGPGISEQDQQKMFKPFTRLSATPTGGEPSNGLGLSIIKSLCQQLGGKIKVESEIGKGTTFIVSIPKQLEAVIA